MATSPPERAGREPPTRLIRQPCPGARSRGRVLVSSAYGSCARGQTFEFTSLGNATLKSLDEPMTLHEGEQG